MLKKHCNAVSLLLVALLASGCGKQDSADNAAHSVQPQVDDPVLARVGESEIRQSQLDILIGRLDATQYTGINADLEQKMVQSLVRARALAIAAEQSMSGDEKLKLEARVQAFRDELLAQHYLQNHVVAQPVTADQVKQYYESNQDEYTTPGRVRYQYLTTIAAEKLGEGKRQQLVTALAGAKSQSDWKAYASSLKGRGLPVEYKEAELRPQLIAESLRSHVRALEAGQVSSLIYGPELVTVKLVSREPDQVQPMHEVSAEIRKKLAPIQLKRALSDSAKRILQEFDVEILGAK